jgi:hypothetical protein
MSFFKSALIFGALSIAFASQASATPMIATFSGTADGIDTGGHFGSPGILNGSSFSGYLIFDTSLGNVTTFAGGVHSLGGSKLSINPPAASPILSASLTINGHTVALDGSYLGYVTIDDFGQSYAEILAGFEAPLNAYSFGLHALGGATGTADNENFNGFRTALFSTDLFLTNIVLSPTSFQVTAVPDDVTAIPEPLTLSLFSTGLAGAISMRRRKAKKPDDRDDPSARAALATFRDRNRLATPSTGYLRVIPPPPCLA